MTLHLHVTGRTDIGMVRSRNEDSLALVPDLGVAIVADGMGGHPGGDVASRIAAEVTADSLRHRVAKGDDSSDEQRRADHLGDAMTRSVEWAHEAIRSESGKNPDVEGMGTTLTALLVDAETGVYVIGHVGDSRVYRMRDGELVQLTKDDTWVRQQVEAKSLTQEQASHHPYRHVLTQCVGLANPPSAHILKGEARSGDVYVLCTDGLAGMLAEDDLAETVRSGFTGAERASAGDQVAEKLVAMANDRGGRDNITVALVAVADG